MIDADGLRTYREGDILESWNDEVPQPALDATRNVLRQLIDELLALPPTAADTTIGELFSKCVDRLNDLDTEHEFICTIEREDLCEELYTLGELCGVSENVDELLSDRDW